MDIIAILNKLAELNLIRLNKQIGNWYSIYCPIHNDGNERKPSCGVLLKEEFRNGQKYPEGFVHCFSCSYAKPITDMISDILAVKGISNQSGLEWLIENIPGFNPEAAEFDYLIPRNVIQKLNAFYAVDYINSFNLQSDSYVSEEELANYRYTVPYMYDRKLTDEIIQKFDVGVDLHYIPSGKVREVPCITFPVRDVHGKTLFIYRRAIKTKNFYMPSGIEKPIYGLYELGDYNKSVIICESIFNALTCWVYGYPAIALLGTGTQLQISQLKLLGIREFVLGLDPDEAGQRGCNKLRKALKQVAIIRQLNIPQGKDINDLNQQEFINIYAQKI